MSIATEITRLQNAKAALKSSLEAKGVTVSSDATLDSYATLIDNMPSSGGSITPTNNVVIFYDYDGTVLYTYTPEEFAVLNTMPENPDHTADGLTSQGWNWTLTDAKTYVHNYGSLNIGQLYITTDRKSHFIVEIPYDGFEFYFKASGSNTTCDWGDGEIGTVSQSGVTHTYTLAGTYTIKIGTGEDSPSINGWSGSNICGGKRSSSVIKKIFFGKTDSTIGGLYNLNNVEILTFPEGVTFNPNYSSSGINSNLLIHINCYKIDLRNTSDSQKTFGAAFKSLSMRDTYSSIGNNVFYNCVSLISVTIPDTVTSIGRNMFYSCSNLTSVIIPNTVTSIGTNMFSYCSKLTSIIIPNSITSINNNMFSYCRSLTSVTIPNTVTSINSDAFSNCISLTSITIPNGVTSIGNSAFSNCISLTSVTIPNTVTSIGNSAFSYCNSLTSITIPNSVTSIGNSAFIQENQYIKYCYIEPVTPPTASNSIFGSLNSDCIIYVPIGTLTTYQAESGWSTYASKMQELSNN